MQKWSDNRAKMKKMENKKWISNALKKRKKIFQQK